MEPVIVEPGAPVGTEPTDINAVDLATRGWWLCYVPDIVVFGKQAEHCGQYLSKGNGVIVDGRLQQRRWEGEDGQKRSKHEVVAQTVTFLPKRPEAGAEPSHQDETGYESEEHT